MSTSIPAAAMVFHSTTLQGNLAPVPGVSTKQGLLELCGKVYNLASYRSLAFSDAFTTYLGRPVPFVQCWEVYTTYSVDQQLIPRFRGTFLDVSQKDFLRFCQLANDKAVQAGVAPLGRLALESGWIQELLRKLEYTWDTCVQQLVEDASRPKITSNEEARTWLLHRFERAIETRLSIPVQRHWEAKNMDVVRRTDRSFEDEWMAAHGIEHKLPEDEDSDEEYDVAEALDTMNIDG